MSQPRILVTSAAGNTGSPATLQLLEHGFSVRAFVRRYDDRAKRLEDAGAEIFVGDQYSIADMRKAMTGVRRAYHCAPTEPNALHFGAVFTIAAMEANLEHIVMFSQWLADPNHPSVFTRETWMNERLLKELPNTTLTIINLPIRSAQLSVGDREAVWPRWPGRSGSRRACLHSSAG